MRRLKEVQGDLRVFDAFFSHFTVEGVKFNMKFTIFI